MNEDNLKIKENFKNRNVYIFSLFEMFFVFIMVFTSGIFIASDIIDKYIYVGLLLISSCLLIIKKRVKLR
jgi:hypothetical protein